MEMCKKKLILAAVLSLFFLSLLIWGSNELFSQQSENPNPNLNSREASESSLLERSSRRTGEEGENGNPDGGNLDPQLLTSCSDAMEILTSPRSAKQWIYPHENNTKVQVLCDFQVDGGGWTVIQKRSSGPQQEFNRTWAEYSNGFGSVDGNFWLGLENIRALTKNGDQELRIELEDFEVEKKWAKYSSFSISDASDFYRLSVGGFSGDSTAGDSMVNPGALNWVQNGMRFSTKDSDNDIEIGSCVDSFGGGGWWFNYCGASHLNGPFHRNEGITGVLWSSWEHLKFLVKTEMKIRKRKSESKSE